MVDRDQPPLREDEIRRAVFGQVDLQTAELEIVSSIYDGFAAAITVKGHPRTIALTREYGDAVQLMAMIERSRSAQSAASEASAAAGDPKGRRSIYDAAYDIRKGAPGLSDATCAAIARSINLKVANGSASERGAAEPSWSESFIADEDDGPVSGIVIDLPDGSQIWTGECSSALLDSMGDERPDGSCLFLTVAIKGKPTRVVASIASTQDGIALARALAAAHVTRSAEPGAIDEDWIRGLISEAVVMAEDQEREDESDEEICRISESVLNTLRPYLRAQPQSREGAQPVRGEIRVIDGNRCRFIERELEGDKWEVLGPAAHPAEDALRGAVEKIRSEINAPLSGPTHGAWDRGRIAGLKEALTALQKGGA